MSQISLMSYDSFLIVAGLGGACPTLPALLSFHLLTFSPSHFYLRPKSAGMSPHLRVSHCMMGTRKGWVFSHVSARRMML